MLLNDLSKIEEHLNAIDKLSYDSIFIGNHIDTIRELMKKIIEEDAVPPVPKVQPKNLIEDMQAMINQEKVFLDSAQDSINRGMKYLNKWDQSLDANKALIE